MSLALSGEKIADKLKNWMTTSVVEGRQDYLLIKAESLLEIASYLKTTSDFDFNYLNSITAVDYVEYFELVYNLVSIDHNHHLILKARCYDRDNPVIASVVGLWKGANFQEREIYDLFGIRFEGHPNMKRILLWDGFQGYPLRKDYNNDTKD